ncbi:MAG TPA: acetylglutamate kinase [Polyangiaceae bacterium]|nr:acetylglutamate kinase [Polyangiaceae bacterium]
MPGHVVLKIGGEVVSSNHMRAIAADVAAMSAHGEALVIVHGGGPQVTELQKRLGLSPTVVGGRRVTDAAALEAVKMAVAGQVNVDACAALVAAGARPVGLHGASALVVRASLRPPRVYPGAGPDPIDLGHVGDVVGVNADLIGMLCGAGYVPVVACLGADPSGRVYNINADTVANRMAVELDARAVVLVTDVPGVLRDVGDPRSRIERLDAAAARRAIADGTVTRGMIPKVEESLSALADGVKAVHVVGRLEPGELARALAHPGSVGTVLVP